MSRYLMHDPTFRVLFPHLAASDLHERGEALLLLLADRSISRVVCAPPLYGKSVLALQYAQIMFEGDRVLWVNAADPRFLRDLDAGALGAYLDDETKLLVIDELAALSTERKRAFDLLLSSVCAAGCEVVVTTSDITLAASLEACIEITAADLQMTPDELPSSLAAPAAPVLEARLGPPVVLLDRPQGRTRFVAQLAARTPASDLERIALAALLLGRGPVRLLDSLAAVEVHAVAPEITRRFPYAGIHASHARFEAFPLTEAERSRLAHRHAASLAVSGHFVDEAAFLEALCASLEAIGDEAAAALLRSEAGEVRPVAEPTHDAEAETSASPNSANGEGTASAPSAPSLPSSFEGVPLDIRLFGRFEMTCDGRPVPPTGSLRRKAKILVALLTVNHNKELPRSWIESAMWPGVPQAKARSSFYNLWSYLCRALEPHDAGALRRYRSRDTISFRGMRLESDVISIDGLTVAAARAEEAWEVDAVLRQIELVYRGPLLPGLENAQLDTYRASYEARVLDALMSGIALLASQGEVRRALHFALFAYAIEPAREDVCYTVMVLQKQLGQSAGAIATFLGCRRALIDRFGIDASRRLDALYRQIIEEMGTGS